MEKLNGCFFKIIYTVYGEKAYSYCYSEDKSTISAICIAFFKELGISEFDIVGCSRISKVPVDDFDIYIL